MAQNVWDYFEERERECKRLSLRPDPDALYEAEAGSDDKRGLMFLRLDLSPRAFLAVKEEVVVQEGGYVHRESYAYFLVIDGKEYAGWERDPSHDPQSTGTDRGTRGSRSAESPSRKLSRCLGRPSVGRKS